MITAQLGFHRTRRALLGWLALPVFLGVAALSWQVFETCENSRLRELSSPDGEHRLVIFERNCSGTVAWTTHASILKRDSRLPDAAGNVLVSFERHGSLVGDVIQQPEIEAQWKGSRELEIIHSAADPGPFAVSELDGVRVTHTLMP